MGEEKHAVSEKRCRAPVYRTPEEAEEADSIFDENEPVPKTGLVGATLFSWLFGKS